MSKEQDRLETYLARRDGLSDLYAGLEKELPAPAIDEHIRTAAHQAVRSGWWQRFFSTNPFDGQWGVPVVVLGLFVLTVGIVFMLGDEIGVESLRKQDFAEAPAESIEAANDMVAKPESQASSTTGVVLEKNVRKAVTQRYESDKAQGVQPPLVRSQAAKIDARPQAEPMAAPMVPADRATDLPQARSRAASGPTASQKQLDQPQVETEVPAAVRASEPQMSPEKWLLHIRRLRQTGQVKAAEESLGAFKKAYPEYPLGDLAPTTPTRHAP